MYKFAVIPTCKICWNDVMLTLSDISNFWHSFIHAQKALACKWKPKMASFLVFGFKHEKEFDTLSRAVEQYFGEWWMNPTSKNIVKSVRIWSYSGPHFLAFGLNTERYSASLSIRSEYGKIRTRITPNADTYYAVKNLTEL